MKYTIKKDLTINDREEFFILAKDQDNSKKFTMEIGNFNTQEEAKSLVDTLKNIRVTVYIKYSKRECTARQLLAGIHDYFE